MLDANLFIKEHITGIDGILVAPDIPEKKLNNAVKAFECEDSMKSILALYDHTLFGSAKEGLIFTGEKMIFKSSKRLLNIYYRDINEVTYYEKVIPIKQDKSETIKGIRIKTNEGEIELEKYDLPDSLYSPLETFLQKLLTEVSEFKEADLLKPIEDMPSALKIAYIKIIINMAFANDAQIDEKELAEIVFLMGRINLEEEERFELRSYMVDISESALTPVSDLVRIIKENAELIHHEPLMISLVKDLFNVHASTCLNFSEGTIKIESFAFLAQHQELFGLPQEKIDFAREAVENDFKILYEDVDDDKIKELTKDLAAKAASIGAPIGAVYLSGSVMGLSAAGMTSGLASLGMGGILGFSSMATGIGVAVLLGVGVYQGIKYLTKDDTLSKYKQRELMLHEVIKQTQKSISLMISDINTIIQKLNDAILHHNENQAKIQELAKMVANFQGALQQMSNKSNRCANIENRLKCPQILEISRIGSLAKEPTKKEAYALILSCYEEQTLEKGTQWVLKKDIATDTLETLNEILQSVGYFASSNIVANKVRNFFK